MRLRRIGMTWVDPDEVAAVERAKSSLMGDTARLVLKSGYVLLVSLQRDHGQSWTLAELAEELSA